MSKIIMHIDLNAFFANAEIINDPSLSGIPLIVAGLGRRSIVSTASYEARKLGIYSGMPTYLAKKIYPSISIKEPNFRLYRTLSNQFFGFIRERSQIIEVASIDECYVDMTHILKNEEEPMKYLQKMQQDLLNKTKLQCSIGIGPTKFLAKMASDYKKPMGITIFRRRNLATTLWRLPIKDMYGIGKKTYPILEKLGIKTIGDLANNKNPLVERQLGKTYPTLKSWANGYGSDEVNVEIVDNKSIGHSSTLLFDTNNEEELYGLLIDLAKQVSQRAKKAHQVGKTIQIVIRNADFTTINRSITLSEPTNEANIIYEHALYLFDKNYKNQLIRLLGITLQKLSHEEDIVTKISLFASQEKEKSKTRRLIDDFNAKLTKPNLKSLGDIKKEGEIQ